VDCNKESRQNCSPRGRIARGYPGGPVDQVACVVREVLEAATLTVVGSAAVDMTATANFVGFNTLIRAYQDYLAMDAQARVTSIRDSLSYKPVLGARPFAQGPGDIAVFYTIYEIIHKLNHKLLIGRFFCTQEELGTSCILNSFTGVSVEIARTTIKDEPVLDATFYCLHSAFLSLLQAFLLTKLAKE
jgi:hypothetical protein